MTRTTSAEAYRTIKENGLLPERQWQVYEILYEHGPLTGTEATALFEEKQPLARTGGIWQRFSELERKGVAKCVGEKLNPQTGMKNYLYDVTADLPRKLKKQKTERIKCSYCGGKGYVEQLTLDLNPKNDPRGILTP